MRTTVAVKRLRTVLLGLLVVLVLSAQGSGVVAASGHSDLLDRVIARGQLVCGTADDLPGFSAKKADGLYYGFDVDFCRAVAAAVFGDAEAAYFVPLSEAERFTAVHDGLVDLLVRPAAWTQGRDTALGLDFGPIRFFSGQQVMARGATGFSEASDLTDLESAVVCTTSSAASASNIVTETEALGVSIVLRTLEHGDDVLDAFRSGACDAMTADGTSLALFRAAEGGAGADWVIFPAAPLSSETAGAAWIHGESRFGDVVRWTFYAMLIAEDKGVTSHNIDTAKRRDPETRRLFGVSEDEAQTAMGLPADAFYQAIRQVGNYAEVFERNLAPMSIARGPNALARDGGLLYAPPATRGYATDAPTFDDLLDRVIARGLLICGAADEIPGFSYKDAAGVYRGFDVDHCRAVAAAILGDADAVHYVPLNEGTRFTAVQSGLIDLLVLPTTWTQGRDTALDLDFGPIRAYGGQQLMARGADGFSAASGVGDVDGRVVCTTHGTTLIPNLLGEAESLGVSVTLQTFPQYTDVLDEFRAGACDAVTADGPYLSIFRHEEGESGADWVIFPEVPISREPGSAAWLHGESRFGDVVRWAAYAMLIAEAKGVTSANIDETMHRDDETRRLFGVSDDEIQTAMGLPADAFYQSVRQVGNYAEVFERHLTPLGLERGPNALARDGGLLYAPPATRG